MDDRIGEACGVFGVYAPGQPVAKLTYFGLFALQHRGQESAGIAVSDGQTITVVKDMGLVTQVFDERRLAPLQGHLAIGHVRYSTTGSSTWRNAQPVYRSSGDAGFALGHNGNLLNTTQLAERAGVLPGTITSDSDLMAELLEQAMGDGSSSDGSRNCSPLATMSTRTCLTLRHRPASSGAAVAWSRRRMSSSTFAEWGVTAMAGSSLAHDGSRGRPPLGRANAARRPDPGDRVETSRRRGTGRGPRFLPRGTKYAAPYPGFLARRCPPTTCAATGRRRVYRGVHRAYHPGRRHTTRGSR